MQLKYMQIELSQLDQGHMFKKNMKRSYISLIMIVIKSYFDWFKASFCLR